ncbi:MAG: hypothetical protein M9962_00160 [Oligoflexia bacterium]|nr:hypothetical protein [Oligoflexia bacterium]
MFSFFTTITGADLMAVGFLIFLEGILSIDNALVLALLVRHLPKDLQKKALVYGIAGAVIFRIAAISMASYLMEWRWVKFVGGAYLVYLALAYLLTKNKDEQDEDKPGRERGFLMTVLVVELTDIAFAVDSILTAVALSNKLWVVVTGGLLGLLMMRFAAGVFIKLLDRFPRFEGTAYLLVFIIGVKLLVDGFHLPNIDFHSFSSPAFWIFWLSMLAALGWGFVPHKTNQEKK